MLFQRSLKLFSFLKGFFLCWSYWVISIILSSRSPIYSSVSLSLLLIPYSVFFSFQLLYSLFLTSSFLYFLVPFKKSHCFLFFCLIQLIFLFTNALNSLSGKLFISVSLFIYLFIFSVFLALLVENISSVFYFA